LGHNSFISSPNCTKSVIQVKEDTELVASDKLIVLTHEKKELASKQLEGGGHVLRRREFNLSFFFPNCLRLKN
jgi:hypothetical protein